MYDAKIEELRSLFFALYGDSADFNSLLITIEKHKDNRSANLKLLDEKRRLQPYWYLSRDAVGLTMYTELFNGTFKGIEEKLPYLKELGITYLHLMPVMKMPAKLNDGGYAVDDYLSMDSKFGTNEEFCHLISSLHKENISICLDFVMNHTSSTHIWAEKAKRGDKEYLDYYEVFKDRTIPDEFEKTTPDVFPESAPGSFVWSEELSGWVMSSFYPFQWDLNYHNPKVLIAMLSNMLELANWGVDVFRLDAVPYIWKKLGTCSRNLPEVHKILRIFRLALDIAAPGVILKGEVVMAPNELKAYFGEEMDECQLLYGVPMMVNIWSSLFSRDARLIMAQAKRIFSLPLRDSFVNYARCHDDIGWGLDEDDERSFGIDPLLHKIFLYEFAAGIFPESYSRGELYNYDSETKDARSCGTTASLCGLESAQTDDEKHKALQRIFLVYGTMWSLKGFPMISSGDEIGQLNDYSYKNDPDKRADSRNVHRSKFNWMKAERRNSEETEENAIWSFLTALKAARSSSIAFDYDAEISTWQSGCNRVFSIRRRKEDKDMLCISSFSEDVEFVRFEYFTGLYKDIFRGTVVEPGIGFYIEPLSVMWIERYVAK